MSSTRRTSTTSLPLEKIAKFWIGGQRTEILLSGFQAICRTTQISPTAVLPHIQDAVPNPVMVPAARTLRRFFEAKTKKHLQQPAQKSGLLLGCYHFWQDRQDLRVTSEDIDQLIKLAEVHLKQIDLLDGPSVQDISTRPLHPIVTAPFQLSSYEPGRIPGHVLEFIRDHIPTPRPFDHPDYPEFPPYAPKFPATPTHLIKVEGRQIMIKDESYNKTGTHKDRWAWEIVLRYKQIIADALKRGAPYKIPIPSMISSGSAALALQVALREKGLHDLRVVMDERYRGSEVTRILEGAGAKIYFCNLEERELSENDVLSITENDDGIDLTTRTLEEPFERRYYDWFAYEVLNECPKHIFVPVGTGELFANVIFLINDELTFKKNDARLLHGEKSIKDIQVYGATTEDSKSTMTKLYARFRPMLKDVQRILEEFKDKNTIGEKSGIFRVDGNSAQRALDIARGFRISAEHSGMAGLALFLEKIDQIPRDDRVLIVNTGLLYSAM